MENVILVDINDNQTGVMEKLEAHKKGLLHRAFSVFIFNDKGELLMQRRSMNKYHSAGLWTNTCCSHPKPGETTEVAANRRLKEEMGIACELKKHFSFIYKASFENQLTEHELDYIFTGSFTGTPIINPEEVMEWKFTSLESVIHDYKKDPEKFTAWFYPAFTRIVELNDSYRK